MADHYATSGDGITIHFIDNQGIHSDLLPLVIVPGMMGIAEHHQPELTGLAPRRVIALTHRGLGKSGRVSIGQCSFEQRATDIETVVSKLGIKEYILYGFSRGVALAVKHALTYPKSVKALVLHDCEPIYIRPSEKWYNHLTSLQKPHMPAETIEAYWKDSAQVDLTGHLTELNLPVMFLRGALEGSLLPKENAQSLLDKMRNGRLKVLEHSSHEVANEDREAYLGMMKEFCNTID